MTLPSSGPLSLNDIQTEFGGTNPIGMNEYYAGGGLVPAGTTGTYGAVPSSGALSIQNFYGTSQVVPIYIEDVFSTYLYTGNGSNQTVNNGIDLQNTGGLVWTKSRSAATDHKLFDTVRGFVSGLSSNSSAAATATGGFITSWTSTGYTATGTDLNTSSATYASWTFREQPKFFDVVTYTGNGTNRGVPHSLGSVPGCVIVKCTSNIDSWYVTHRSFSSPLYYLELNSTAALQSGSFFNVNAGGASPMVNLTETTFGVGTDLNVSGQTYVAYVFAHNSGGFGLTGTDNVISCGSFTSDASGSATVTLGYEPQWILYKNIDGAGANWNLYDNMRGFAITQSKVLYPNLSNAETIGAYNNMFFPTATGFVGNGQFSASTTFIYIAIRRGPMKVPTSGTSVFLPYSSSSTTVDSAITTGFPVDLMFSGQKNSNNSGDNWSFVDRLRGVMVGTNAEVGMRKLLTTSTAAEGIQVYPNAYNWWNTGVVQGYGLNGASVAYQFFRRAPGFFDEVCDTGTGAAHTVSHNLQAIPQLIIRKGRSGATQWEVYSSALANTEKLVLNSTSAKATDTTAWNSTTPTSSVFTVGTSTNVNASSATYVTYLFATCPGVSKVGTYTGTGATQTISCGFTGGARFVLIKRTNSTGDWYVWDTARGMVSGTDPSLLLNDISAEVNANSVYTTTGGFQIVSTAAGINASGGSYIFLAIA